ncbi:MAG TPA: ATP-binding protein [Acidimicrobiales bacterium]
MVAWSATLPPGRDPYVLAHAVSAAPYLAVTAACAGRARRLGPPAYRGFWACWLAACAASGAATASAIAGATAHNHALLAVDAAFLVVASVFWTSATIRMVRLLAGRRSMSVDLVDAVTALVVLGAPALLFVAEPVSRADETIFAVPFAASVVLAPGVLYLMVVNLVHAAPGERATLGLGMALGVWFSVSITMQLARVVGEADLDLPVMVAAHVVTMSLMTALPLWAHRRPPAGLGRLPVERQVRGSSPMPYLALAVLPALAVYVLVVRRQPAWGVEFLVVVLLVVVALGAVRHTALMGESRRLYGELGRMAEERRRLIVDMVQALEADRCRTATELHAQVVWLLAAMGTTVQSAYAALPADAALTLRETFVQTHGELGDRAEQFRRLMLATRPRMPVAAPDGGGSADGEAAGDDRVLVPALTAYASELFPDPDECRVEIHVEPGLELDWRTTTVAYHIAREALLNTARHARASAVAVRVAAPADGPGGLVVEVSDDGVGFEAGPGERGSGLALMELFAELGGGRLRVESAPGQGTRVRGVLNADPADPGGPAPGRGPGGPGGPQTPGDDGPAGEPRRPHLRLVASGPG